MEKFQSIINNYVFAKDKNKPHLMEKCFCESALLEMEVNTGNISFPEKTSGLEAITDLLVKNFHKSYENISTFCISNSSKYEMGIFQCKWFVVMIEKESNNIKVGSGKYYWKFNLENKLLVNNLKITIDKMVVLKRDLSSQLLTWSNSLPYPWCGSSYVLNNMPNLDDLNWLRAKLEYYDY
jgi:hypothetical protein